MNLKKQLFTAASLGDHHGVDASKFVVTDMLSWMDVVSKNSISADKTSLTKSLIKMWAFHTPSPYGVFIMDSRLFSL